MWTPPTSRFRLALSVVLLAPLGGCPAPVEVTVPEEGPVADASADDLAQARQRWAEAGAEAYTLTLQRICFCPVPDYTGPFEVTVRGGALASVTLNGDRVEDARGMTVAALFDLIEEAYARDAHSVAVEYDERYGFPVSVGIDYDERMADEEIGYRVSDFRAG